MQRPCRPPRPICQVLKGTSKSVCIPMTSMQPPVSPLICEGHPRAGYRAAWFEGEVWIYCPKCVKVIDRRPATK